MTEPSVTCQDGLSAHLPLTTSWPINQPRGSQRPHRVRGWTLCAAKTGVRSGLRVGVCARRGVQSCAERRRVRSSVTIVRCSGPSFERTFIEKAPNRKRAQKSAEVSVWLVKTTKCPSGWKGVRLAGQSAFRESKELRPRAALCIRVRPRFSPSNEVRICAPLCAALIRNASLSHPPSYIIC